MGSKQMEARTIVRTMGRFLPARHFKGTPVPGRWMRGGTERPCLECGASVGKPCGYRENGEALEVRGFVHVQREDVH